jgi:hypothetical protein
MTELNIEPSYRELSVIGSMDNAIDGTTRLLCDVQRFGFRLSSLSVEMLQGARAEISMTIAVPAISDPVQVLSRLARHTTLLSLRLK